MGVIGSLHWVVGQKNRRDIFPENIPDFFAGLIVFLMQTLDLLFETR